ncbi:MAG: magnesium transporter [Sphingobacteriia bacterium]|nr:magnesium transporter [Sphingobacteriia bacterium]
MIIYVKVPNDGIKQIPLNETDNIPTNTLWIDLIKINIEEEKKLEDLLKINIPTAEETQSIFISNRLYEENKAIYMSITLYHSQKGNANLLEAKVLTFVLVNKILITIRDFESNYLYDSLNSDSEKYYLTNSNAGLSLLLVFLRKIINEAASFLEEIGHNLDDQNKYILNSNINNKNKPNHKMILKEINNMGNSVSKIRESLITISRMIIFLSQSSVMDNEDSVGKNLKIFLKDISALSDHSTFLSNKVSFLLDALLGLINIEQNNIIKIFSLLSVVFMPPTLIASIYGMNFEFMPELKWFGGYPAALIFMCISSWVPYKYFKKKKWL